MPFKDKEVRQAKAAEYRKKWIQNARFPLTCSHCACHFEGTYKQQYNAQKTGSRPFCSTACRLADASKRLSTEVPTRGPCQHCGSMFKSRREAMFCDMNCYMASDRYKEVRETARLKSLEPESRMKLSEANKRGADVACLECGTEFYQKRETTSHSKRLFCSRPCYRTYLAARYDRWIANPQSMSLPQAYDEFLDRHELPCLIHGCDWRGVHLSTHVNIAHGIKAKEFKRASGFNLSTGLIGKELAQRLSERAKAGVALKTMDEVQHAAAIALSTQTLQSPEYVAYSSLEGCEHRVKAQIFTRLLPGPDRVCDGCGMTFQQKSPMGKAKFCSIPCRTAAYAKLKRSRSGMAVAQGE